MLPVSEIGGHASAISSEARGSIKAGVVRRSAATEIFISPTLDNRAYV